MDQELSATTTLGPISAERSLNSISVNRPLATIAALAAADIVSVIISLSLASEVQHLTVGGAGSVVGMILPTLVSVLCGFIAVGLYPGVSINPVDELRLAASSITVSFLVLWSATVFRHGYPSKLIYVLAYLFAIVMVPLCRAAARKMFCQKTWWGSQVVILGYGDTGKLLCEKLQQNPLIGLRPYAVLDDDPKKTEALDRSLLTGPLSQCLEITAKLKISYGIVCMPGLSREGLLDLLDRYGQCFGHILVIPNLVGMTSLGITAREVGGIVGLEVKQQLLRPSSKILKRLLDTGISLLLAPIVIPLVAFFALLIKLEDSGPAFYSNERIGMGGRKFKAWKLRSMVTNGDEVLREHLKRNPVDNAHWQATQKLKRDPRLTAVGRLIRKASIDELPQFWNVLAGEMSVVGPRPMLENQVDLYGPSFKLYKQVRPGITGLWQVSGRNQLTFAERVILDKYVIQNWSVWLDIYILARTFGAVVTAHGAY